MDAFSRPTTASAINQHLMSSPVYPRFNSASSNLDEKERMKLNLSDESKPRDETEFPHRIYPEQESAALVWVQQKRDQIVKQMTDACLNQCLDALISHSIIFMEDYELIKSKSTRSGKVRNLMDTCDLQGESFARIIVQKLKENRHSDLCPFPEI
ncbi:unnamed protein product [Ranitomeya imitator]|uniref:CARD domain-containing protein n=1 Tax=Ranitomeya imitator TaxID=111125 RepID=A0ABN9MLN5_9NEOB|nr:unnamed protein product [Ranitomeya imitator]